MKQAWLFGLMFAVTCVARAETYSWCGAPFASFGDAANWRSPTGPAAQPPDEGDDLYGLESRALDLDGRTWRVRGWDSTGNWSHYTTDISNGCLCVTGSVKTHSDTINLLAGGALRLISGTTYIMAYNDASPHRLNIRSGGRLELAGELKLYQGEITVQAGGSAWLSPSAVSIYPTTEKSSSLVNRGDLCVATAFRLSDGSSKAKFTFRQAGGTLTLQAPVSDGGLPGSTAFIWEGGAIKVAASAGIDFANAQVAANADVQLVVDDGMTFDFGATVFGTGSCVTVTGGGGLRPPANPPAALRIEDGELQIGLPGTYDLSGITLGAKGRIAVADGLAADKRARLERLGFYNDGYLGTWWDYGTWGAMTREQGCAYLRPRPQLPYGGEFATVTEGFFNGSYKAYELFDPARYNIVKEWYDTHLSYLRTIASETMTVYREMAKRAFRAADSPGPGRRKTLTFAFTRPEGLYLSGSWRLGIRLHAPLADEAPNPAHPRRPFRFANESTAAATDDGYLPLFSLDVRAAGPATGGGLVLFR